MNFYYNYFLVSGESAYFNCLMSFVLLPCLFLKKVDSF